MSTSIRRFLLSLRELLTSASPLVIAAVALLWLAYWWLNPTPPKHITLATGPAQSAYAEFGARYAQALKANGIEVRLLPSEGSSANLQLLREGKADIGFVQGGSAGQAAEEEQEMQSLGSLFVEPIWLFYREAAALRVTESGRLTSLAQLRNLRINVGAAGSGVPNLMSTLLDMNHVDPKSITLSRLDQTPATVGLLGGTLDAVVFASAPESPMVQMLLQTPGIRLMDFPQNEAYARRLSFLTPVVLPRGVVDLARNMPAQDVRLIATTTAMLARDGVHPALLQLVSQATLTLHSNAGWFNRAHEFPKASIGEFPLAPEAERTLRNGVPTLQRYLPFSWANLVERMWLALGIIVAVLLPLGKIAPPLYAFRVRSRVFRWYGQLRDLEERLEAGNVPVADLLQELNDMETRVEKVIVPLSYADELYALRNHIDLVRQRLLKK
ncbi:TAXI family TRAP transporter solute-binding subunit [Rhodoferax saidenbachensis]|uniref:C4-dicarboxylate ABC transporter substrate-binding protein n=1 Tax=Rhodoferax saidenbachensis TaxID=1484693 RepID=A0A1P8K7X7_9BURK|nr:TAXI family TRAP transporter solute-binding subunit [Rhodoferax saidenbachensis]APW42103.1 C4-dicarboxylate ABC transporter substrate-binding protein [Rhodoferax saidenbachensis]